MRVALHIALKDILLRMRDRSALLWGVVAPLVLATAFSLVLGGVIGESLDVRIAIVDLDRGPLAAGFVSGLSQLDTEGVLSITVSPDVPAAEALVSSGDADAAIVVREGFSEAVGGGSSAAIEVIGFADSPIGTQVAESIAEQFASEVNGISVAVGTYFVAAGPAQDENVEAVVAAASEVPTPLTLTSASATSKVLSSGTFYSAAMAVFFLFFTVQFGVIGLIEEKEQGTMPRLLAAPIRPASILGGKVITAFILGIVSMTVLVVATTWLPFMDADWGDPVGVGLLIVAGVLSAMGVVVLVAAVARTAEAAASIQAIVAFVLGMLGGAFFPIAEAGGVLAKLSLLAPHAWFLRGLGDLGGGETAEGVLFEAGVLVVFGMVCAGMAAFRLRRVVAL